MEYIKRVYFKVYMTSLFKPTRFKVLFLIALMSLGALAKFFILPACVFSHSFFFCEGIMSAALLVIMAGSVYLMARYLQKKRCPSTYQRILQQRRQGYNWDQASG